MDGAAGTASSRQGPAFPKLNSQFSALPSLCTVFAWVMLYLVMVLVHLTPIYHCAQDKPVEQSISTRPI